MSIKELREAVEAGTARPRKYGHPDVMFFEVWPPTVSGPQLWEYASKAYDGSLDAAKRLHDALVPDHRAILDFVLMEVTIFRPCHDDAGENTDEWDMVGDEVKAFDGNMARAWLIALLRALEEDGRDG